MENRDIKELFKDWTEPDEAIYYLASLLGLMSQGESLLTYYDVMGFVNSKNDLTNIMFNMLEKMVEGGMLESNSDTQYRWNKLFIEQWKNSNLEE